MSRIIAALREHACVTPDRVAIEDESLQLTWRQLLEAVERTAAHLRILSPRVMAILADNGISWVVTDLSALMLGVPLVPLPSFFSESQLRYVLRSAGIDYVVTDQSDRWARATHIDPATALHFHGDLLGIAIQGESFSTATLPEGTWKITFTSGTTGEPKGVCLGVEELETAAESLRIASSASQGDRHLCLLPLATLLENIGGIYAAILAGALVCIPRLASVGVSGSSGLDIGRLMSAFHSWRATTAILIPQMLQALIGAVLHGAPVPDALRYLAVGGAPVSAATLDAAWKLGLPVYEGYGLSECASVVAVNRPGLNRRGTVGRPLPHLRVALAEDGEILVQGVRWRGYLGHTPYPDDDDKAFATGDLGYLDSDGYLHITGRKKNIFITSFGRNVAPEWVERELTAQPPILQAAVFGEGRPFNTAVIFAHPATTRETVAAAIETANSDLPDYAGIRAWVRADEPFVYANSLSTANGRLRRSDIYAIYAAQIDAQYSPRSENTIS